MPESVRQDLYITGAGIVSPLGFGCVEHEQAFAQERTAFAPVQRFDVSQRFAKTAGLVDLNGERLFHSLSARHERRVDHGTRMMLVAMREAMAQAGLKDAQGVDAIIIGTSAGAMVLGEQFCRGVKAGPGRLSNGLSLLEHYLPHRQMAMLAKELDWPGNVVLVSNACASGANAIGMGMDLIRAGRARRVLAGGYDAIAELVFAGFDCLRALAPSGIPRPFDAARDGLALGEGAGAVVLESAEARQERGAEALCRASGYAMATDLHHLTQPDPEGKAAVRTMRGACEQAGVMPEQVNYINSHGTGTPFNDAAEGTAIAAWGGEAAKDVAVSSTKSAMGHLLGGAGAVEAVICVMALTGGWMPGSLNIREPDAVTSGFTLLKNFRRAPVQVAMTNSFGFGGTNATLVLKEAAGPS